MGNCCGSPVSGKRGGVNFTEINEKNKVNENDNRVIGNKGRYEPDPTSSNSRTNNGTAATISQQHLLQRQLSIGKFASLDPCFFVIQMFLSPVLD